MIGDSKTSALIQKALDGTWQRQRAISNNIANHETPGYKALRVSFEEALEREVKRGTHGAGDIKKTEISMYTDINSTERADGNNVNIDLENIEMVRAQIQYQYLIRTMADMYSRLKYAISEGKR